MPALTDIAKYKRLAELFAWAIRADLAFSSARRQKALDALQRHGLNSRQADRFLEAALQHHQRNMLAAPDRAARDVRACFRPREHGLILEQVQSILEADAIALEHQTLYDICFSELYRD